jgi:nucleoside-diphosphate-sugar epimerase
MKNILVTGSSGFLASAIVMLLKNNNEYKLITTDIIGNVDYLGDLSDKKFVNDLPDVDIVVHCAAVQYVTKNIPFFRRNAWFNKNNVLSTQNIKSRYSGKDVHLVHIYIKPIPDINLKGFIQNQKLFVKKSLKIIKVI